MESWVMYVIIGVVLVLMIVLTIIPQKKRQKQQQQMMDSLQVGTKVMTIGRMVGKITQVNTDNTLIINVGTEANPTLIVIDRQAVGMVLENVAAPAPAPAAEEKAESVELPADQGVVEGDVSKEEVFPEEDAPAADVTEVETDAAAEQPTEEAAAEEQPAEQPAEGKKSKKHKK